MSFRSTIWQASRLDDYAAVCLLDPPPLVDGVWQSLTQYVDRGGGLAVWLGRNAQPKARPVDDFNTPAALKIMPGKLARQWHRQDAFLAPQDYQHPLLANFSQRRRRCALGRFSLSFRIGN